MLTLQQINTQHTLQQTAVQPQADEVLKIYVASAGLVFLALERINKKFYNVTVPSDYQFTEVDLYSTLGQPQVLEKLNSATRTQIIMRTFEAANQALAIAMNKLPLQEPFEASKTATNLLTQLEALTSNHKSEVNVNNFVWDSLIPNEAKEAIEYLRQTHQLEQIQSPNPSRDMDSGLHVIDHEA